MSTPYDEAAELEAESGSSTKRPTEGIPSQKKPFSIPDLGGFSKNKVPTAPEAGNLAAAFSSKAKINIGVPSIPKIHTDGKHLALYALWAAAAALAYYSYQTNAIATIKDLPLKRANLAVLKENVAQTEKELEALENMKVNSKELEEKESALESRLPTENEKTALRQFSAIQSAVRKSGITVATVTKSSEQWKPDVADKFGAPLADLGIGNFYQNAWFNRFVLTVDSPERDVMKFKEEVETDPSMTVGAFKASRSDTGLKYEVTVLAFYTLTNTENEGNR